MITKKLEVRIRYSETDKMGYVYYGNYARYFEIGRTELLRSFNFSYKELEEQGVMMPVVSLNVNYKQPALYDDLLRIKTFVKKLPSVKMEFNYETYNENNELLNSGSTILVFVSAETRRPVKAPSSLMSLIESNFVQ